MKFIILMSLSFLVVAETKLGTKNIDETKVKYKSSKRIDFQSLLESTLVLNMTRSYHLRGL